MHTAQDGDMRLAELWDRNMVEAGYHRLREYSDKYRGCVRKFALDLVDDKFQTLKAERDAALKELAALKAANTQPEQPEPAETEDERNERNGRECYEEWKDLFGLCVDWKDIEAQDGWIAFAKRRPKVEKPAPKLREPGQVLCDALSYERATTIAWEDCSDDRKCTLNRVARNLGIEAQP